MQNLHSCFLSEQKNIENDMLEYVRYVFAQKNAGENNYANVTVLKISQLAKKVHREQQRLEAFIHLQPTGSGLHYCIISPDFNLLPLVAKHCKHRYEGLRCLIYDHGRDYGIYYNLTSVEAVQLCFTDDACDMPALCNEDEELYQLLWQQYVSKADIPLDAKMKLCIRYLPKTYWKHLTEKRP